MKMKIEVVQAAVLLIGDELLCGQTRDVNLASIARRLEEHGVRVAEARIVPDEAAAILSALNQLRNCYDFVFTTGGIGPTHDDITADVVARAFGTDISQNEEAVRRLREHYANSEYTLNESRLRMARIPEGARLIDNPISAAPGFMIGNVLVMAGVPEIMQAMLEHAVTFLPNGKLEQRRAVRVFLGEGDIAMPLRELQEAWQNVRIGCYPSFLDGKSRGIRIVLRSRDEKSLESAFVSLLKNLSILGATPEILDANSFEKSEREQRKRL